MLCIVLVQKNRLLLNNQSIVLMDKQNLNQITEHKTYKQVNECQKHARIGTKNSAGKLGAKLCVANSALMTSIGAISFQ